jgi:hypothetical protein
MNKLKKSNKYKFRKYKNTRKIKGGSSTSTNYIDETKQVIVKVLDEKLKSLSNDTEREDFVKKIKKSTDNYILSL